MDVSDGRNIDGLVALSFLRHVNYEARSLRRQDLRRARRPDLNRRF
jgi:hypothetical protein